MMTYSTEAEGAGSKGPCGSAALQCLIVCDGQLRLRDWLAQQRGNKQPSVLLDAFAFALSLRHLAGRTQQLCITSH